MSRAVQQHMVAAKWGRIVNLSSTSALGNRGQANYSTAKAGLQGFTKSLAIELGKFGVTANCIAPGFIVSEMTKATAAHAAGLLSLPWDQPLEGWADDRILTDTAGIVTRFLDYSMSYRAMVELLARLHLAGLYRGDCSPSNTLFRPEPGVPS